MEDFSHNIWSCKSNKMFEHFVAIQFLYYSYQLVLTPYVKRKNEGFLAHVYILQYTMILNLVSEGPDQSM